jgi:hypothetical protein
VWQEDIDINPNWRNEMKLEDLKPGVTVYKANTSRARIEKGTIAYIDMDKDSPYPLPCAMNSNNKIIFTLYGYNIEGFKNNMTTNEVFLTIEEAAMWILSNKVSYEAWLGKPFPKSITYQSLVQSCK